MHRLSLMLPLLCGIFACAVPAPDAAAQPRNVVLFAADPHESENLAADPAYADVLARYEERLRDFQRETADPWLLKWSYE